jgi:hypothetical protein
MDISVAGTVRGMSEQPTLKQIAADLYEVPPAGFVAARNARAKELGKPLAVEVRRLPKPTPAAWLADTLAREHAEELEQAIAVGASLRQAQHADDRGQFVKLDQQRRSLVKGLVRAAESIGKGAEVSVSPAVLDEVAQTLNAALSDESAADALRSAALVRPLQSTGLEPVDLSGALPWEAPAPRLRKAPSTPRGPSRAEKTAAERKRRAEKAQRERERRQTKLRLEQQRTAAAKRVEQLETQLEAARHDLDELDRRLR